MRLGRAKSMGQLAHAEFIKCQQQKQTAKPRVMGQGVEQHHRGYIHGFKYTPFHIFCLRHILAPHKTQTFLVRGPCTKDCPAIDEAVDAPPPTLCLPRPTPERRTSSPPLAYQSWNLRCDPIPNPGTDRPVIGYTSTTRQIPSAAAEREHHRSGEFAGRPPQFQRCRLMTNGTEGHCVST